jgi:hypothetical protein
MGIQNGMGSINPIDLEVTDGIFKSSIVEDEGYLLITFHDDLDDAYSEPQTIKIHPADFDDFVGMLNKAAKHLPKRQCHYHSGLCEQFFACSTCDVYKVETGTYEQES